MASEFTWEQRARLVVLSYADLLVEQGRLEEARQPENWEVLVAAFLKWEPLASLVHAGLLEQQQVSAWLDEALRQAGNEKGDLGNGV